jgi:hypothetical protein
MRKQPRYEDLRYCDSNAKFYLGQEDFKTATYKSTAVATSVGDGVGHLMIIDEALGGGVETALGMEGEADTITRARDPSEMDLSSSLSLIKKAKPTLMGRPW